MESLREWREVAFGSRVRDRVFWFGIVMNTMLTRICTSELLETLKVSNLYFGLGS